MAIEGRVDAGLGLEVGRLLLLLGRAREDGVTLLEGGLDSLRGFAGDLACVFLIGGIVR